MTYNPNIPQAFDLPSDSQADIESNFLRLNEVFGQDHIPFGNLIEEATQAAPIVCTSTNHRLTSGDTVTVFNMEGLTNLNVREDWPINGNSFTVTVIDENTFSLDASDSTTYPTYLPNSGDFSSPALPYGYHTKNFFPTPRLNPPSRAAPRSAYFTQNIENLAELFFQNGASLEDIVQLTDIQIAAQTTAGWGFTTPWGLRINIGDVIGIATAFTTYNFPLPFQSVVYSLTLSRGRIVFQSGTGGKNPVGNVLSLSQFQVQYQRSGTSQDRAHILYMAVGV